MARFGLVKHSGRKIKTMWSKRDHAGTEQPKKVVHVRVYVKRASRPANVGRTGGYWAHACVGKHGSNFRKCGPNEFGRTPTLATKKALVALGRAKNVK